MALSCSLSGSMVRGGGGALCCLCGHRRPWSGAWLGGFDGGADYSAMAEALAVRDADLPESGARYRRSGGEILPVCKREYRQQRLGHSSVLCGYAVSGQKTRNELATSLSLEWN